MVQSLAPRESSSLQATRQMLDELDALMERMLALPVHETDEPALRDAKKAPTLAASLTLLEPARVEVKAPLLGPPPTRLEPLSDAVLPPTVMPRINTMLAEVPPAPPTREPWWIGPLLWGNAFFDQGTVKLGRFGDWLRASGGRFILGYTGVAMLILAVVWSVKDALGWTW